jgi:HAD superfamily hydrolase (TIGR01509 family)
MIVLLDFDGLLVDTEPLHYAAYMQMAQERGVPLDWSFAEFCKKAHVREHGFFYALEEEYPAVFKQGLSKEILYADKKRIYENALSVAPLSLMEGVESVLRLLQERDIKRAVVTNSPRSQITTIQEKLPLLKTIPLWVTREDYKRAKPAPDGYLEALKRLKVEEELAVGFEDSVKGLQALLSAGVEAVFVSPIEDSAVAALGVSHIQRLSDFPF